MKFEPFLAVCAALALAACEAAGTSSPIPLAESYPATAQQKLQAAQHWQFLAAETAEEVTATLDAAGLRHRPLAVVPTAAPTVFDAVFGDFLVTELVRRGNVVPVRGPAEVVVAYDARIVGHRGPREPANRAALRLISHGFPVAETPAEVVVTTSMMRGEQHLGRISRVFYVNAADTVQYTRPPALPVKAMDIVGAGRAAEPAERLYRRDLRK